MTVDDAEPTRVTEKWGFGMAPVKPGVHARRLEAAQCVLDVVDHGLVAKGSHETVLGAISEVKGLMSRCFKADQWDWFTVWRQLGRPSPRKSCQPAAQALARLRRGFSDLERAAVGEALNDFDRYGGVRALTRFLGEAPHPHQEGLGYIYVLSTRQQPTLLKIGYTSRDVVERVNEINRATGVAVPFGVRGLWVVRDAAAVEKDVHAELAAFRVRPDREFFEMNFGQAVRTITEYLRRGDIER